MLSMDGKYEEAEEVYKKVVELEPAFPGAWYNLGLLYNEMKKYEEAQEAFNQAIIRQPGNLRMYYNRALTLQKLKKFVEAEKLFYTALQRPEAREDRANTRELAFALIMLQLEMKNMQKAQESIGVFVQNFGQKGPHMQAIKQKMQQLHREMQKEQNK